MGYKESSVFLNNEYHEANFSPFLFFLFYYVHSYLHAPILEKCVPQKHLLSNFWFDIFTANIWIKVFNFYIESLFPIHYLV